MRLPAGPARSSVQASVRHQQVRTDAKPVRRDAAERTRLARLRGKLQPLAGRLARWMARAGASRRRAVHEAAHEAAQTPGRVKRLWQRCARCASGERAFREPSETGHSSFFTASEHADADYVEALSDSADSDSDSDSDSGSGSDATVSRRIDCPGNRYPEQVSVLRQWQRDAVAERALQLLGVQPDGDCFIACLLGQEQVSAAESRSLRQRLIDWLDDHPEAYVEALDAEGCVQGEPSLQEQLLTLRRPGQFQNRLADVLPQAAAAVLGRPITIITQDPSAREGEGGYVHSLGAEYSGPELVLVRNGDHFLRTVPAQPPGTFEFASRNVADEPEAQAPDIRHPPAYFHNATGVGLGIGRLTDIAGGHDGSGSLQDALRARLASELPGEAIDDLVRQLEALVRQDTSADLPNLEDRRRLLDSDRPFIVSDGTAKRSWLVDLRLVLPQAARAGARHCPPSGRLEDQSVKLRRWMDFDYSNKQIKVEGNGRGMILPIGWDPLSQGGVPSNSGLFAGADVGGSTARRWAAEHKVNLSSVCSARGRGEWVSFAVQGRLDIAVATVPTEESGLQMRKASLHRRTDLRPLAPIDVTATVDFPFENTEAATGATEVAIGSLDESAGARFRTGATFAPESMPTDTIRRALFDALGNLAPPGSQLCEDVHRFLGEDNMMRFADSLGSGHSSMMMRDVDGNELALTVSSRPSQVYRVGESSHVLEFQRKAQIHHPKIDEREGTANFAPKLNATLPTGTTRFSAGINISAPTHSTTLGDRNIVSNVPYPKRKTEFDGQTTRYRVTHEWQVRIHRRAGDPAPVRATGEAYVLVPSALAQDFESRIRSGSFDTVRALASVGTERFPPRSLMTATGLGGAHVEHITGAEAVQHSALELATRHLELEGKAFDHQHNVRRQIEGALSPAALWARQEALFGQGVVASISSFIPTGSRTIVFLVRAVRDADTALVEAAHVDNVALTLDAEQWKPMMQSKSTSTRMGINALARLAGNRPDKGSLGPIVGGSLAHVISRERTGGRWSAELQAAIFSGSATAFDGPIRFVLEASVITTRGQATDNTRVMDPDGRSHSGRVRFLVPDVLTERQAPASDPVSASSVASRDRLERGEGRPVWLDRRQDQVHQVGDTAAVVDAVLEALREIGMRPGYDAVLRPFIRDQFAPDKLRVTLREYTEPGGKLLTLPVHVGLVLDVARLVRVTAEILEPNDGSAPPPRKLGDLTVLRGLQAWALNEVKGSRGWVGNAVAQLAGDASGARGKGAGVFGYNHSRSESRGMSDLDLDRIGSERCLAGVPHELHTLSIRWKIEAVSAKTAAVGKWSAARAERAFTSVDALDVLRGVMSRPSPSKALRRAPIAADRLPAAARTTALRPDAPERADRRAAGGANHQVVARAIEAGLRRHGWRLMDRLLEGDSAQPAGILRRIPRGPQNRALSAAMTDFLSLQSLEALAPTIEGNGLLVPLPSKGGLGYLQGGYLLLRSAAPAAGPADEYRHLGSSTRDALAAHELRIEVRGEQHSRGRGHEALVTPGGDRNDQGAAATFAARRIREFQTTAARVSGLFTAFKSDGGIHDYEGPWTIEAWLVPSSRVSPALNSVLLGVPQVLWSRLSGQADALSSAVRLAEIPLQRTVTIPDIAFAPALDTGTPSTRRVPIQGDPLAGHERLPLDERLVAGTGTKLIGIDPRASRQLSDALFDALTGGDGAGSGVDSKRFAAASGQVTRFLAADGQFSALHDTLNQSTVASFVDKSLVGGSDLRPLGHRPGVWADTTGDFELSLTPVDPQIFRSGYGEDLRLPIVVDEDVHDRVIADGRTYAGDARYAGQLTETVGNPEGQPLKGGGKPIELTRSGADVNGQTVAQGRIDLLTNDSPYVLVGLGLVADARIHTTDTARGIPKRLENESSLALRFEIDNAATMAMTPAAARASGLRDPTGNLTRSGIHFPDQLDSDARFEAAQRIPKYAGWTVVCGAFGRDGFEHSGKPVGPEELESRFSDRGGLGERPIVIAAGNQYGDQLGYAREHVERTGRAVVVPGGVPAFGPDGNVFVRGATFVSPDGIVTATRPDTWQLMLPHEAALDLGTAELATAMADPRVQVATTLVDRALFLDARSYTASDTEGGIGHLLSGERFDTRPASGLLPASDVGSPRHIFRHDAVRPASGPLPESDVGPPRHIFRHDDT